MRRRLSAYFDRKNCRAPDDLADETLNRLARRLEEEGTLDPGPPARYCYVVARFVFLEYTREAKLAETALSPAGAAAARAAAGVIDDDRSMRLSHLDSCLEQLPRADRLLILEYYGRSDHGQAERRRTLAARLGLTANALAIRACRIRETLERCVRSREGES